MKIVKAAQIGLKFNPFPEDRELSRSRKFIYSEDVTGAVIRNLSASAFLVGYAKFLGASDEIAGIISAIPVLSGLVQLFSPLVFEKMEHRKKLIVAVSFFFRMLLGSMLFIPFFTAEPGLRVLALAVMYLIANLCSSFVTPGLSNWIILLIPQGVRGRFFGLKECFSLIGIMIANFSISPLIDLFKNKGQPYTGFFILFSTILVFAALDLIFMSRIQEVQVPKSILDVDIKTIITKPFKDKSFRKVIVFYSLWYFAWQIGAPFFGVMLISHLKMDYTYITTMMILQNLISIPLVWLWGMVADKKSWNYIVKLAITVLAIGNFTAFFLGHDNKLIFVPIIYICSAISFSGINMSIYNLQFNYAPLEGRTMYVGLNSALAGIMGFISALIGSVIVGALKNIRFHVLEQEISNLQVVFGLSAVLMLVTVFYVHFILKPVRKEDLPVE